MRVFFRTDSSKRIGSGHVIRCLTLANELRANGADISFVCREHDGHLIDKIIASGFDVRRLSFSFLSDQNKQHFNGYLSWLGVEQSQDAEETIDHLKNENCDLLIVDHYALDATWEKLVRPYTQKIMVIDDLANRVHDCDVLLDQNYLGANQSKRYSDKVPSHCQCFLGPEFSLLQPQYESLRDLKQQHNGQVQSILVFFGGTDPSDYTSKALQALAHPDFEHLTVHTVIGANHPNPDEVKSLVENLPKGYYHENLPSLAGLMLQCDFMIGGGGTTTWEKMCLGVPAIVATIAENQEAFSKALAESGYHLLMNRDDYESQKSLQKTISSAIHDHKWLLDSSENSAKLVDGLGAKKLAFYLLDKKQNMYFCKHQSRQKEHLIVAGKLLNGLTVLKTDVHEKNDDRIEFSTSSEFDGFNLSKVDDMRLEQLAYLNEMLAIEQKKFLAESVCETKPNKQLKITILTEKNVWLFKAILELCTELLLLGHQIRVVYKASDLIKGDVCLMLGYTKIIKQTSLDLHQNNLVVHNKKQLDELKPTQKCCIYK